MPAWVLAGGHGALLAAAKSLALDMAEGRAPRRQSLQRTDKLGDDQESSAMCGMARSQAAKTQPNLVHPRLCVDAVLHGLRHGSAAGLAKEREVFNTCVHSEVGSALVHIFLSRVRAQHRRRIAQTALLCGLRGAAERSTFLSGRCKASSALWLSAPRRHGSVSLTKSPCEDV